MADSERYSIRQLREAAEAASKENRATRIEAPVFMLPSNVLAVARRLLASRHTSDIQQLLRSIRYVRGAFFLFRESESMGYKATLGVPPVQVGGYYELKRFSIYALA